jgi:hypothetical protein
MKRVNGKNGRLRIRIGGAFEKVMAQVRENIRRASCPYGSCRAECRMKKGNDCLMAKQFAKENHRVARWARNGEERPAGDLPPLGRATRCCRARVNLNVATFGFAVGANLDVVRPNRTLAGLTTRLIDGADGWLGSTQPDVVLVGTPLPCRRHRCPPFGASHRVGFFRWIREPGA